MRRALSVLVPAHDEARVLGRCLQALLEDDVAGGAEILVVANGCTDTTAQVARDHGVPVLELADAGKAGALQAGDQALDTLPRVYLDADVVLSPGCLQAFVDALPPDLPRLAAPRVAHRTTGRPLLVRAFYRVFEALPYVQGGPGGAGVYALSAAGRRRFAAFPDLTADDLFVQRLFGPEETVLLPGHTSTVEAPATVAALLAVRTRVARGNAQLASSAAADPRFAGSTSATVTALARLVRAEPRRAGDALVYVGVTLLARARARRSTGRWDRDTSTR